MGLRGVGAHMPSSLSQVYYAEMTHGPDAFDSTAHEWEHFPYTEAYGMSDKILVY